MADRAGAGTLGPRPAPPAPARPPGFLDYYLGTKEGRSRLLLWIWVLSVLFMGVGYALIFWIFFRGGL